MRRDTMEVTKQKEKKNTVKKIIIAILILLLLVIGGCQIIKMIQEKDTIGGIKVDVDGEKNPQVTSEAGRGSGIAIPGWNRIELPAGQKRVKVYLPNPEENKDKYDLSFELRLKSTGEVLCKTDKVEPGKAITEVTLERELKAGTYYDAIIRVQPYRMADGSPTNNADIETVLLVKG